MNNIVKSRILLLALIFALGSPSAISVAADLPEYRPALLTHGPRSLINLINVQSLMKRGQGSATVMFDFGVSSLGFANGGEFYRGTPNSDMLGREVMRRCNMAEFEPAVYRHTKVAVWVCGTVSLIIKDGKPHLRIYLNQEPEDLMKGHDFIAPQFVLTPGFSKFRGFYWPQKSSFHEGMAVAALDVDRTGHVTGSHIEYEYPPGMGFGAEVAGRVTEAVFIPAFRDGKRIPAHLPGL